MGNCLLIAKGQERRGLFLEIILYLANASHASSSKQIWFSNPADS